MKAELRDSLEFLFSDSLVSDPARRRAALDVARGGTAAVHLLINGLRPRGEIRLGLERAGRPVRGARWFRLVDVPVEVNTGPVGFIEREGQRNPHVIRRAPFRVYDAMEPVEGRVTAASATLALRLHLPVPADARAGGARYVIVVRSGASEQRLALDVQVHSARIPAVGPRSLPYTNWFSVEYMATRHGIKPWSEAHWRMIGRYARTMVHARQNMFWVPLSLIFTRRASGPELDRERLRRLVRVFSSAGMYFIEGGHFASRTGGEWLAKTFDLSVAGLRASSPEGYTALARMARALREEIERNGWRERWVQHVADEPIGENAHDYRLVAGAVRKHLPGLPILDATMHEEVAGAVDWWCPQAQEFQKHREFFESQRRLGDRVLFYTCCFPGGPWLNRLMDMELLRPALFGWAAALFRLDGFLHWGLNHYKEDQDPFRRGVVAHGGNNSLPAGDTHIVYPGRDGPWSSVRLEAQREGFEDYELLRAMQAERPRAAAPILARVIRGFDDYTKDTRVLRAARRDLLRNS